MRERVIEIEREDERERKDKIGKKSSDRKFYREKKKHRNKDGESKSMNLQYNTSTDLSLAFYPRSIHPLTKLLDTIFTTTTTTSFSAFFGTVLRRSQTPFFVISTASLD